MEYVSLELNGVDGAGYFHFLDAAGGQISHRGIDQVEVLTGTGKVRCVSGTQLDFDGRGCRITLKLWLTAPPDSIHIMIADTTSLKVAVGHPSATVRLSSTQSAGTYQLPL